MPGTHPFPTWPRADVSFIGNSSPVAEFASRAMAARGVLEIPDLCDGDLSREQRREALRQFATMYLTLQGIVDAVVALEDFIREYGRALAASEVVRALYPTVDDLAPKSRVPRNAGERTEEDPFPFLSLMALSKAYANVFGVEPLDESDLPRLQDLVLLRHCVSHHGMRLRSQDASRFVYYDMTAGMHLAPQFDFASATIRWLFDVGSRLNQKITQAIYFRLVPAPADIGSQPSGDVASVIELAGYMGLLPLPADELPSTLPRLSSIEAEELRRSAHRRAVLLQRAVTHLEGLRSSPPAG